MNMKHLLATLVLFAISDLFGQELPSTTLKTLDGQSVNIKDAISDEGPTVISFWATWCKPCIKELTAFMDYAIELEEEVGAKVLAVSIDDSRNSARVAPMAQGQGWEYTILLDENQDLKRNLGIVNVPFTLVLNSEGEVVWKHSGYSPGDEEELAEIVTEVAAIIPQVTNPMKNAFALGFIAFFASPILAQEQSAFGGQLHGNFQLDGQLYLRDESIDPTGVFS